MDAIPKKPGQVSSLLGVSGMTLRNYVKQFEPFLSEHATATTNRRFSAQDIRTLQFARQQLGNGFTYEEVSEQLSERPVKGEVYDKTENDTFPEIPVHEYRDTSEPEFPRSIQPIEFFTKFVEQLREEHQTTIQAKDETISELKRDKERLERQLDWERLPWFRKIVTKPPED